MVNRDGELDVSGKGEYPKTISLFSSTRSSLQNSSPDYRPYKPLKPIKGDDRAGLCSPGVWSSARAFSRRRGSQ